MTARVRRTRIRAVAPVRLAGVLLAGALLLLPTALAASPPPAARVAPSFGARVVVASFAGSSTVESLASERKVAIAAVALSNGSTELVAYDPATNTTTVVQPVVPGGPNALLESLVAAGNDSVFLAFSNAYTGRTFFERVGPGLSERRIDLPLDGNDSWSFVYGGPTRLYAFGSNGHLIEIDPATRARVADLTPRLYPGTEVDAVLPAGSQLYVAGSSYDAALGVYEPYLGVIASGHFRVLNLTSGLPTVPRGTDGAFESLARFGAELWAGGDSTVSSSTTFGFHTATGILERFDPATGRGANESRLLPNPGWGVFGEVPFHGTLVFDLNAYNATLYGVNVSGGIASLGRSGGGPVLVNRSSSLPATFVPDVLEEVAASGGWFFCGGTDTAVGGAELVAIHG
jgi:hypothetical protein